MFPDFKFKNTIEEICSKMNFKYLQNMEYVIAPDLPPPYTIGKRNLETEPYLKIYYDGFCVRKRPAELPSQTELKHKYGFDNDLLIYVALSGPGSSKEILANTLLKISPEIDAKILISKGEPGRYEYKEKNVIIKNWIEKREEILKASDILISRCGHNIIAENLTYGKKCIYIPQPNQSEQYVNAESIERLRLGYVIEDKDITAKTLKDKLNELIDNREIEDNIKKIKDISQNYIGEKKIAEKIRNLLSNKK